MAEDQIRGIESANINSKWLENIYDNIQRIEKHERLAREGCESILEYIEIPISQRSIFLSDIQYKNLKLLFNEFILVIPDISPVIGKEKTEEFKTKFNKIGNIINIRHYFITEKFSSVSNSILSSEPTALFYETLKVLSDYRLDLIMILKEVLYIAETRNRRR